MGDAAGWEGGAMGTGVGGGTGDVGTKILPKKGITKK